ncbi:MAG: signal peptide peptidase SppA [Salibacteraceae bacterium]
MKQFVKYMFASTLGTIIAFVAIFVLSGIILAGVVGSAVMFAKNGKDQVKVKENSVLVVNLEERLIERKEPSPFDNIEIEGFEDQRGMEIKKFLSAIDHAKTDDHIKGILVRGKFFAGSMSTMNQVREAIEAFQDSGKFVLAYEEVYTQGAYYIASAASEVYLNQEGILEMRGMRTELAFFKGALDKLGIDATIIKGPDNIYKSAIEPFTREDMSEPNKEQIQRIVDVIWSDIAGKIAESRGFTVDSLNSITNNMLIDSPESAAKLGLVDDLAYYDQILANLREKLALEEDDDIESISIEKYAKSLPKSAMMQSPEHGEDEDDEKSWELKDEIAVIYAVGGINSGKGDSETIGSETLAKAIREARTDDDVKAIVMRVNSPGGSALASDVIWREAKLAGEVKPFIVSFGSVAASGGYYISASADRIFANHSTVTGSIGVFGIIPDPREMLNDKLGITFDGVKTHDHADFGSLARGFDDAEMAWLNSMISDTYEDFLGVVAEGRGMSRDEVDSIARGRVWIGSDALEIGLIDEIGNLDDAIAYAAQQAELEDYELIELPKQKDPWEAFFEDFSGNTKATVGHWVFGDEYKWLEKVEDIKEMEGVQARMPYEIIVE